MAFLLKSKPKIDKSEDKNVEMEENVYLPSTEERQRQQCLHAHKQQCMTLYFLGVMALIQFLTDLLTKIDSKTMLTIVTEVLNKTNHE